METNRKIIAIVFQDERPWSVVTADGCNGLSFGSAESKETVGEDITGSA
jgi:hypothetical protein